MESKHSGDSSPSGPCPHHLVYQELSKLEPRGTEKITFNQEVLKFQELPSLISQQSLIKLEIDREMVEGLTEDDLMQEEVYGEKNKIEDTVPLKTSYNISSFQGSSSKEFLGLTKGECLSKDTPGCLTSVIAGLQTARTHHELSDEVFDGFNVKYDVEYPVHGHLPKLQTSVTYDYPSMTYTEAPVLVQQTSVAYDHISMTYTQAPVPVQQTVQFTVQPSSIPGASLGVFFTTSTEKGVFIDPNEGDKNEGEQNLQAYQNCGKVYYRTLKTIAPHTELLVGYGDYNAIQHGFSISQGAAVTAEQVSANISGNNQEEQHEQLSNVHTQKISSSGVDSKNYHRNPLNTSLTEEKPYKCDYCEYRCTKKSNLQVHTRKHTGEKPYKCDYCEYSCARKSYLVKHVRTHTGEKPYKCHYCDHRCARKDNLELHIRTHTGEKPYSPASVIRYAQWNNYVGTHSYVIPKCTNNSNL